MQRTHPSMATTIKMPNLNFFQSEIVESDVVPSAKDQLHLAKKIVDGKEVE